MVPPSLPYPGFNDTLRHWFRRFSLRLRWSARSAIQPPPERNAYTKPLTKRLINQWGSFANVLAADQAKLQATHGLGIHSVAALKLVQAAAPPPARAEVVGRHLAGNWEQLMDYPTAVVAAREPVEQFRVLFLDTRNRIIADEAQARGTVNHTPVYPREVVKRALEVNATALILVHNHPSGDPKPSRDDIKMT
jgi:DNA repair protein RadC